MYQVGDFVFYGGTGVCRVMDITRRDFSGVERDQCYYVLKPLYQDCTIYTPVDKLMAITRPVISKEEAELLIDQIPAIETEVYQSNVLSQLQDQYEACLKTYDCAELMKLSMSIYAKKLAAEKARRKFGAVDEKYMKRAEDLLFGELAASLDLPKSEVPAYIANRVEHQTKSVHG